VCLHKENGFKILPGAAAGASGSLTCLADPILALGTGKTLSPATALTTTMKNVDATTENFMVKNYLKKIGFRLTLFLK
jgi:hypothetical protein